MLKTKSQNLTNEEKQISKKRSPKGRKFQPQANICTLVEKPKRPKNKNQRKERQNFSLFLFKDL